jgi:acyl carrier protein
MTELSQRLQQCFAGVFPQLPAEEIPNVSAANCPQWDSLALMTLLALIEEEFGVQVPADDIVRLNSFQVIHDYLQQQ